MSNDDFKIPNIKMPSLDDMRIPRMELMSSQFNETLAIIEGEKEEAAKRETEYRESVVKALQGIEKNTALLTEMTLLLQKSNEKQDEIFQIMIEILAIMKSSSVEEADSKFKSIMKKVNDLNTSVSTMQSLVSMATTVHNAYQAMFP
jgi:hypothetical protein